VSATVTRIFSDLHYGDPASRVRRLAQLWPLLDGVGELILNGDTLDTRPGRRPAFTAECRAEVLAFFPNHVPRVAFLTGNHDPNLSAQHTRDLAAGQVFVTHGDILFANIVPWGRDARIIGRQISAALAALAPAERDALDTRLGIWRRVAAGIPQRHQSEPRGLKYALGFIADTVWPPLRILRVLQAWRDEPVRAAQLARRHRPTAKFVVLGHTHRPGRLVVRNIEERAGDFHPAATIAEFPLAWHRSLESTSDVPDLSEGK